MTASKMALKKNKEKIKKSILLERKTEYKQPVICCLLS